MKALNKILKKIISIIIIIVLLGVIGHVSFDKKIYSSDYIKSSVPTLFFHGWGGSYRSESQMANYAKSHGVTDTIIRVDVSPKGKVTLNGRINKNTQNPIIEVNYLNNKNDNYSEDALWMKQVVVLLQKEYNIKRFNVVGHSMGNMTIAYYPLDYSQDKSLPKLNKQVDIAGHYNGILGMNDEPNKMKLASNGKPEKMDSDYKQLLKLREVYPNNQVGILNIYGDKNDGTHSDGSVSNASSKSLRYLVSGRAKSYREKKISGPQAQHSKLHENKEVDKLLINFLWKK
ncbi:cell surface hydrolase [Companilactobacillus nodensis DSM 19682 = JCM 14932 = NBRC 107160]|uniref:Cell surface hydrolase n=1 Tax=Companilactobacillus nodensis DSM 19682 = JCM 14932 = NBRC 107160 TaxID=1423775 RepID=A0A0R1KFG4_9LACO|nr:alpha/beta hydrolase [Companilactobacillus nodensis]KRK78650.1 cell surface hydrolase [Companilactobacillus nodensis DSM 19682 = JCM 14932 = NBRC 107160]